MTDGLIVTEYSGMPLNYHKESFDNQRFKTMTQSECLKFLSKIVLALKNVKNLPLKNNILVNKNCDGGWDPYIDCCGSSTDSTGLELCSILYFLSTGHVRCRLNENYSRLFNRDIGLLMDRLSSSSFKRIDIDQLYIESKNLAEIYFKKENCSPQEWL